jgi:hypothetical protein
MSYEQVSANAGRKRTRTDYFQEQPLSNKYDSYDTPGADPGSPMPFVNTRYMLAGGMDTPTLKRAEEEELGQSMHSDIGYRRELSGDDKVKGLFGEEEESSYQMFPPLDTDRQSSRSRASRSSNSSRLSAGGEKWAKTALEVVGGVVGKVWEFCKTSAFRGFHAGGGNKYTVTNTSATHFQIDISERESYWESGKITTEWGFERESTPLPGRFPEEQFIPDYMDRATPEGTPPRPAKRRQVSRSNTGDEITKNWVVVPPPVSTPSKPQQPRPTPAARYSMPTASSATRRNLASRPASRASAATGTAPRRPMLQHRVSHAGSPALQSNQGASFASPRSPGASKIPRASPSLRNTPTIIKTESPAAKEAQKWAALKRKEEREADESIRRLDAQLKAMIKEGKEALGTKIEVDFEDEGPVGARSMRSSRWNI